METTRKLADFVVSTEFSAIPPTAVHDTKRIILDEIGCALGGYAMAEGPKIVEVARAWHGEPESTIIGSGDRFSSLMATFANTKIGNLMDFDDVFMNAGHQSPMVFFATLAVAEAIGASGKDLITAFAAGFDVASRVVLAFGSSFHRVGNEVRTSQLSGFGHSIFGAVASVGKLLRLDSEQMLDAFGHGSQYTTAPLSKNFLREITPSKFGFEYTAMGGVLAAYMARNGLRSQHKVLDDDLYAQLIGKSAFYKEKLVEGLGGRWYISDTSIKPYPHCRHSHYPLCLIERIVNDAGLGIEEIKEVVIRGLASYSANQAWCTTEPKDHYQGQFSIPYAAAMVALRLPPGLAWLEPGLAQDPRVRDFMKRVRFETEPRIAEMLIEALPEMLRDYPTTVSVTTFDGRVFTDATSHAKGDPFCEEWRCSDEALIEKFKLNAGAVLPAKKIDKLIESIFGLDETEDIRALHDLLHA